jgi:glutathione S-transferase
MLDLLDTELASNGRRWLLGDAYSAVDAYAFMLCRWTRRLPRPARARANLAPYLERMLARPAVTRVLAAEGLAKPWV